MADQGIMTMYRNGIINVTRVAEVLRTYEGPPHGWGDKSPWRLFNATTFALTGKVAENPAVTRKLHDVIDGVCKRLNRKDGLIIVPVLETTMAFR